MGGDDFRLMQVLPAARAAALRPLASGLALPCTYHTPIFGRSPASEPCMLKAHIASWAMWDSPFTGSTACRGMRCGQARACKCMDMRPRGPLLIASRCVPIVTSVGQGVTPAALCCSTAVASVAAQRCRSLVPQAS